MNGRRLAWLGLVLPFGLHTALAQDGDEARQAALEQGAQRCINLHQLARTEVIDDQTIAFLMRNGDVYINNLDRSCPGLEREERFMYTPTGNRLCSIDTVTVLEQWGFGLTRGFTCTLGEFHPSSEAALVELRQATGDGRRGRGAVEVEQVDQEELDRVLENERRDRDQRSGDDETIEP